MKLLQFVLDPSHSKLAFVSEAEDPVDLLLTNLPGWRTLGFVYFGFVNRVCLVVRTCAATCGE